MRQGAAVYLLLSLSGASAFFLPIRPKCSVPWRSNVRRVTGSIAPIGARLPAASARVAAVTPVCHGAVGDIALGMGATALLVLVLDQRYVRRREYNEGLVTKGDRPMAQVEDENDAEPRKIVVFWSLEKKMKVAQGLLLISACIWVVIFAALWVAG